jgi:hypothetical protein
MSVEPPAMKEVSAARAAERAVVRVAAVFLLVLVLLFAIVTSHGIGGATTYAGADYDGKPIIGIGTPRVCVRSSFYSQSIVLDLGSTCAFSLNEHMLKVANIVLFVSSIQVFLCQVIVQIP